MSKKDAAKKKNPAKEELVAKVVAAVTADESKRRIPCFYRDADNPAPDPAKRREQLFGFMKDMADSIDALAQIEEQARAGELSPKQYSRKLYDSDVIEGDAIRSVTRNFIDTASREELEDEEIVNAIAGLEMAATEQLLESAVTRRIVDEIHRKKLGGQLIVRVLSNNPQVAQASAEYIGRSLYQAVGEHSGLDLYVDKTMAAPAENLEEATKRLQDAVKVDPIKGLMVEADVAPRCEAVMPPWHGYDMDRYRAEPSAQPLASAKLVPALVPSFSDNDE